MNPNFQLLFEFLLFFGSAFFGRPVNAHTNISPNDLNTTISNTMAFCVDDVGTRIGSNGITPPSYPPPQVPLNVDGYDIAPEGLDLEQVHVYVRHGERHASLLINGFISCLSR